MNSSLLGLLSAALFLAVQPMPASAHHSRAIYSDELSEISGELLEVNWSNPHPRFTLRIANAEGQDELWRVEVSSNVMNMERRGLSREQFRIGETVIIAGFSSRVRPRDVVGINLMRPDGTEVLLRENADPYFSDRYVGVFDHEQGQRRGEENMARAASENRGVFRVWSQPFWEESRGRTRLHRPFTEAAIAARAEWDVLDNYVLRCEPPGMPRIILNPHPFEFVDEGSTIVMHGEEYDIVRTIHMETGVDSQLQPPSRQGFSVGRLEDNTLVVETTRIDWPYFDGSGTPQSSAIEIVENYTLSEDQSRLDYQWVIRDPAVLSEPAIVEGYWLALGAEIQRYDCQQG